MNESKPIIPIRKDTVKQQLVPSIWQDTLTKIVEALKNKDYQLKKKIPGVEKLSEDDALMIAQNIKDYGDELISLPQKSWETSACLYMGDFWDVFIDLYTEEDGYSDLVLSLRVYESNSDYIFKVHSVYVP